MRSTSSDTRLQQVDRTIVISGIRPIMFDRYAGDNDTRLAWQEKVYLKPGTNQLVLPVTNVSSFYTAHNTNSAPKRLRDKRKYKDICNSIQSFVLFSAPDGGEHIPFLRNGEPIEMGEVEGDRDPLSGIYMHRSVARLDKGIPNPKERPVLPLPWSLKWNMTIIQNDAIKEQELRNLTIDGGIAIGFGTYRGTYGKFMVDDWS